MTPVIEAKGLQKRYGKALAVRGVDLTIHEGEVFGLLGPNGSGKTTTILMLLGLTEPTGGTVRVAGFDPLREPLSVKRHVGYLPDMVGFYETLTAQENLAYTARLAGIPHKEARERIQKALERVGLDHVQHRKVAGFSHGMRQRLGIAELLVKQAKILILDEPTNGLDPQATLELLKLITELKREGLTIIISSHLLNMVQSVCDRVALFKGGKVALLGAVDDLARDVLGGAYTIDVDAEGKDLAKVLAAIKGVVQVTRLGNGHWRVDAERDVRSDIARKVIEASGALREMLLRRASLEDVYSSYFTKQEEKPHAA